VTGNDEMEELEELLAAYVIDALDEDERDDVDVYLDADPARRAEANRLTEAFDALVLTQATATPPPPDLWDRIAGRLADEGKAPRDQPISLAAAARRSDAAPAVGEAPTPTRTDELAARRGARSVRATVAAIVIAAAAVVLVVAGLALRPKESDSTMTAARVEQQAAQAAALPGASTGTLTSGDGNVDVKVVLDPNGHMYAVPQKLPALDEDHSYQLWALDSGTPTSLGVLRGAASMELPPGEHPTKLALSKEPRAGSPQPTTTPLAAGQLA
jgi:anti-sigma-K factor RskA